jgi:hypothetical protein
MKGVYDAAGYIRSKCMIHGHDLSTHMNMNKHDHEHEHEHAQQSTNSATTRSEGRVDAIIGGNNEERRRVDATMKCNES